MSRIKGSVITVEGYSNELVKRGETEISIESDRIRLKYSNRQIQHSVPRNFRIIHSYLCSYVPRHSAKLNTKYVYRTVVNKVLHQKTSI